MRRYGEDYVPAEKRVFVSKVKNAQEAHEAIRPTDIFRLPCKQNIRMRDIDWVMPDL